MGINRQGCAMKKTIVSIAVMLVLSLLGTPVLAQTEKTADELGPVAEWVLKEGLEKTLDESITLRIGLDGPIPIRHKGYRTTADDLRHAFAIAPKGNAIFLSQIDADSKGYIWRTTRAGVLLMTLKQEGSAMKVVPNSQAAAQFAEEKKYFLSKIPVMANK
jgi:hypothetical protein